MFVNLPTAVLNGGAVPLLSVVVSPAAVGAIAVMGLALALLGALLVSLREAPPRPRVRLVLVNGSPR